MFGDGKLNDDTIRYFAKHEFYLADPIKSLEIQLDTYVELLDLMTVHQGISSKRFARRLQYLRSYRSTFQSMQVADHLFVIRVAYFLNDLGINCQTEHPVNVW
jgi:hypothetical protein